MKTNFDVRVNHFSSLDRIFECAKSIDHDLQLPVCSLCWLASPSPGSTPQCRPAPYSWWWYLQCIWLEHLMLHSSSYVDMLQFHSLELLMKVIGKPIAWECCSYWITCVLDMSNYHQRPIWHHNFRLWLVNLIPSLFLAQRLWINFWACKVIE